MKKRVFAIILAAAMTASLTACGGAGAGAADAADATAPAETPEGGIRLVNNKVEVDEGLKKLAKAYEEKTGVPVVIESLGGGIDTQATLKGYYQADNMPDIFVFEGDLQYPTWEGLLADLSDEPWVSDTEAEYVADGKVWGFPTTTEAIGLAYNADILAKAGVRFISLSPQTSCERRSEA